ncbi:hypothetical protein NDU88_000555 [Pleurodeles waltl]|uniref:Uncharacterized protein n=1 Tax=Pleurodeles waltl TaxID=8319 RepID=A0AAV7N8A0_PLEWA|nr:hypothetical protein NDU88_000555 [Pleurodeles waltl]
MAMGGRQKKEKTEGRNGQNTRRRNRQETERQWCAEEDCGMKTKTRKLKEMGNRKKTESRRIQSTEEGEDAQKPSTFYEEHG